MFEKELRIPSKRYRASTRSIFAEYVNDDDGDNKKVCNLFVRFFCCCNRRFPCCQSHRHRLTKKVDKEDVLLTTGEDVKAEKERLVRKLIAERSPPPPLPLPDPETPP